MAHDLQEPMGPGFFIFFHPVGSGISEDIGELHDRIQKDDNEIIEIITMLANCNELI